MNLFGGIIRFKNAYTSIFILTLFLITVKGYSQSNPLFLNTQRLVDGIDLQPGAVYIIDDVELSENGTPTNVDAILRLKKYS